MTGTEPPEGPPEHSEAVQGLFDRLTGENRQAVIDEYQVYRDDSGH